MSRLHWYSPGLSPNMFADVLTAMDMTFFFCWAKVFPWAGSWTLFLMTAGCLEEHCWAGWKLIPPQWNYHLCEQLLFFWHDLQQEAWGCEGTSSQAFSSHRMVEWPFGKLKAKWHSFKHHFGANTSNAMNTTMICNSLYYIFRRGQKIVTGLDSGNWWTL